MSPLGGLRTVSLSPLRRGYEGTPFVPPPSTRHPYGGARGPGPPPPQHEGVCTTTGHEVSPGEGAEYGDVHPHSGPLCVAQANVMSLGRQWHTMVDCRANVVLSSETRLTAVANVNPGGVVGVVGLLGRATGVPGGGGGHLGRAGRGRGHPSAPGHPGEAGAPA